jgi:hypothetical protein
MMPIRSAAIEFPQPKTLELEQRLSQLELLMHDIYGAITVLNRRTEALQAQLDFIEARGAGRFG